VVQYLFEILRCARPGMDIFEPRASCDPTLIGKFRKLIGEEGVDELPAKTIAVSWISWPSKRRSPVVAFNVTRMRSLVQLRPQAAQQGRTEEKHLL